MTPRPSYSKVLLTFARNSLVRDMMFPGNFLIEALTSTLWMMMNLGFYILIFEYVNTIGDPATDGAWNKYQFFVFIATTMIINSLFQAFFMPNLTGFSELIRTGGMDFAMLKPIDTQFLISFQRFNWSSLSNFVVGVALILYAVPKIAVVNGFEWSSLPVMSISIPSIQPTFEQFHLTAYALIAYPLFVLLGVCILYSVMIILASTSIWLGRNQSLTDFWFYITNFSRYPMEIYEGNFGDVIRLFFTFAIPILVVINVPARFLAKPMKPEYWYLALFAVAASVISLLVSRWVFQKALVSYRSASS